MKIVVIGGSGLIGSKLVKNLRALGHEAVSASPSSGVDALTGKGLKDVLKNAQVVIDVANSPSFDEKTSLEFFEKTSKNLVAAEKEAGVKHHVILSIVGTERLSDSGYFHAKNTQEELIKASGIPYTIVKATQFLEFLGGIAQTATTGQTVSLPPVSFQPIAAEDVAAIITDVAVNAPINNQIEIAGPEKDLFPDFIQRYLKATNDPRSVKTDPNAAYFGMNVTQNSLVPVTNPRLGKITLDQWLKNSKKIATK